MFTGLQKRSQSFFLVGRVQFHLQLVQLCESGVVVNLFGTGVLPDAVQIPELQPRMLGQPCRDGLNGQATATGGGGEEEEDRRR